MSMITKLSMRYSNVMFLSQAGESDASQSVSLWRPRLVLRVMSEDIPLDTAAPPTDLRRYLRT